MGFALFDITYMAWHDWGTETSVSGAANVPRAKTKCQKVTWFFIFASGLVATLFTLIQVIMAYRNYAVTTSMALTKYTNLKFPAVTVCNQNRMACSRLESAFRKCKGSPQELAKTANSTTRCEFKSQGNDSVSTVAEHAEELWEYACQFNANRNKRRKRETGKYSSKQEGPGPPSQESLGVLSDEYSLGFTRKYMYFTEENRKLIGHEFDMFVVACSFKQRDCLETSNFWPRNTPSYGNCFTFNTALKDQDSNGGGRVTSLTGPDYGLSLVLNVEQDKYMENQLTKMAGARIAIHSEYDLPLMDEYGHNLMPNTVAAFSIQEVAITRQKDPFTSHCISSWDQTNYTDYIPRVNGQYKMGWNYTLLLCQRVCLLALFNSECNCTHSNYIDDDFNRRNFNACELGSKGKDYECVNRVYNELDLGQRSCDCNTQCNETDYNVIPSLSRFPSDKHSAMAQSDFGFSPSGNISMIDNLLRVDIYFATLNVQTITETPVFSSVWSNEFISALGGALSLYLGISIAMVFELVEFFLEFAKNSYAYTFKAKRPWYNQQKKEEKINLKMKDEKVALSGIIIEP